MSRHNNIQVTKEFLDSNPDFYFVFGDNLIRQGYGGAAILRDHPQAIGFVTKKFPDNRDTSFYDVEEYDSLFLDELQSLKTRIETEKDKTFYISQLGGGLANRYKIWENLIKPNLEGSLNQFDNVVFCWDAD